MTGKLTRKGNEAVRVSFWDTSHFAGRTRFMCVRICVCMRMCMYVQVCACMCMCVCICVYVHVCVSVCLYVCMHMCICGCVYMYMYFVHVCVIMWVWVYVCACVYVSVGVVLGWWCWNLCTLHFSGLYYKADVHILESCPAWWCTEIIKMFPISSVALWEAKISLRTKYNDAEI